jgi:cobalt-precorrin 5A hydrolase
MRVVGLGFRASATVASLDDALARAGGAADLIATLREKAAAPVLLAFAAEYGLAVRAVGRDEMAGAGTLTRSARVAARFGTGSVAEAAALVAAGPGARLLGPRVVSADGLATAAIAERIDR